MKSTNGLICDSTLKMTNIVSLTEKRLKRLTMADLKAVLSSIEENEAEIMVNAIKEGKWDMAANVLEFVTYRTIQKKVQNENN